MSTQRLSQEQRELKAAAQRFAREELAPIAAEIEAEGAPMPREVLRLMAERGFMGLDIPEALGGLGLDGLSCACEQLADVRIRMRIFAA